MSVKTILVCLTTESHAETLMKAAVPLARRHGAHLIGLHTLQALEVYPGVAMYITSDVRENFRKAQHREAEAIKAIFDAATKDEAFVSEWRLVPAQASLASERMVESARSADIVLMAHDDKQPDRYDQRNAISNVIKQCGRPVIVVPLGYEGPEIGQKVLVGWSDTREAARAVHDALELTNDTAEFTVLRVTDKNSDEMKDTDLLDLSAAISRRAKGVKLVHTDCRGSGIGEELLRVAFENGIDLIVTGAYGHSKAYDFVVGATTSELLRSANVPVLFSK